MDNFFKTLRISIVHVVGIALPGFIFINLLLWFSTLIAVEFKLMHKIDLSKNDDFFKLITGFKGYVIFFIAALSYVFGHVFRLDSPDKLDRISRDIIIKKGLEDKKQWPFLKDQDGTVGKSYLNIGVAFVMKKLVSVWSFFRRIFFDSKSNDEGSAEIPLPDKYPYFDFEQYLEVRRLNHLTEYAQWCSQEDLKLKPEHKCRSKTIPNMYKMEIRARAPHLINLIESLEAHIRLIYGTWISIRYSLYYAIFLLIPALTMFAVSILKDVAYSEEKVVFVFAAYFLSGSVLFFTKRKIEGYFHYRRVNELFHVVYAKYLIDPNGEMKNGEQRTVESDSGI